MSCVTTNRQREQGEQKPFVVSVEVNGVATDMNGSTFYLTIKKNSGDSDAQAIINKKYIISTANTLLYSLDFTIPLATTPGVYKYEILLLKSGASSPVKIMKGDMQISDRLLNDTATAT